MTDSITTIDIDGRAVPLRIRRNARARRLILRLDEGTGGAVVTIPQRTALKDGIAMARRQSAWIAEQLRLAPARVPFRPGAVVPVLGVGREIRHDPVGRGVRLDADAVYVAGRPEHLARRLTDWLKILAKAEIEPLAIALTERLPQPAPKRGLKVGPWELGRTVPASAPGRRVKRVVLRDTRSRWGSCAADGTLNFSWRLVLAPDYVLEYVVAHEVAHLVHRDHGPAFWALTETLTSHRQAAKAWLNTAGRELHRYG